MGEGGDSKEGSLTVDKTTASGLLISIGDAELNTHLPALAGGGFPSNIQMQTPSFHFVTAEVYT